MGFLDQSDQYLQCYLLFSSNFPVRTWRRNDVASTTVRRHFDVMCPLSYDTKQIFFQQTDVDATQWRRVDVSKMSFRQLAGKVSCWKKMGTPCPSHFLWMGLMSACLGENILPKWDLPSKKKFSPREANSSLYIRVNPCREEMQKIKMYPADTQSWINIESTLTERHICVVVVIESVVVLCVPSFIYSQGPKVFPQNQFSHRLQCIFMFTGNHFMALLFNVLL